MANPRIDELRRRLDREPGSRLFGQLAEELRKDGDLPEAIRVARTGLAAHPNYPSARMTLGRALFDTGDLAAARGELELVLRGAPDNILASRMLAECLEGQGDFGAALLQYRAALRLAPGDRQADLQIRALEQRLAGSGGGRAGLAPAAPPIAQAPHAPQASPLPQALEPQTKAVSPPRAMAPPSPAPSDLPGSVEPPKPLAHGAPASDPVADFDDFFEPAPSWVRAPGASARPAGEAISLLDEEALTLPGSPFVAPRAAEAPPPAEAALREAPPPPAPAVRAPEIAPPPPETLALDKAPEPPSPSLQAPLTQAFEPSPRIDEDLSFEAPMQAGAGGSDGLTRTDAFEEAPPSPEPLPPAGPTAAEPPASAQVDPPVEAPPVSTSTLAELYFDQGFADKAVQVYEELLEREPQNERARARLIEIKSMSGQAAEGALPDPRAQRRLVLEGKIARLEEMLAAVRRG